jgi:hypothetical protein
MCLYSRIEVLHPQDLFVPSTARTADLVSFNLPKLCFFLLFLHGSFCPRRRWTKPGHFAVILLAAAEVSLPDGRDLLRRGRPRGHGQPGSCHRWGYHQLHR